MNNWLKYGLLIGVNAIYASLSICTKSASQQDFLSLPYFLWIGGAVGIMGIYAILWQQIIQRMEIAMAYMFKGTSIVFVLLLSAMMYNEPISIKNIVGALIIIVGIILYSNE